MKTPKAKPSGSSQTTTKASSPSRQKDPARPKREHAKKEGSGQRKPPSGKWNKDPVSPKRAGPGQKKSLSQIFLLSKEPCFLTLDLLKKNGVDSVLEIGPGDGILTQTLLEAGLEVTAVETDPRFVDHLSKKFSQHIQAKSLSIIHKDILEFDPEKLWTASGQLRALDNESDRQHQESIKSDTQAQSQKPRHWAICGFIPYHISSSIVFWLLPQLENLKMAIILVQKEFGERLVSEPQSKSYGSLSVYTQLRSQAHLELIVDRSCFQPIPNVDSALISLVPKKDKLPQSILDQVETLTRKAFAQRRKKLSNSLASFLREEILTNPPLDLTRRADSLSPEEFVSLTKTLNSLPS